MKKTLFLLIFASLFTLAGYSEHSVSVTPPSGKGLFSVSKSKQVRFAKGNLVYSGSYHFAAHQYDYGGRFGWGTGSKPNLKSTDYFHDYNTFDDWGSHISGGWRTLSANEWHYVVFDRTDASSKCGAATVCGVHGIILLPDIWSGGTFVAGSGNDWNMNVYSASSWSAMEAAGAVFLPVSGIREGLSVSDVGLLGAYWSSTPVDENRASVLYIGGYNVIAGEFGIYRSLGLSVRLVQDY